MVRWSTAPRGTRRAGRRKVKVLEAAGRVIAERGADATRFADVAAVGTQATFTEPGLENGIKVLNFNKDFAFDKPGSETRRTYLVSSPGSNFIFNGSMGNAGTLYSIVNYVAPAGGNKGDTASLTGGQ